MADSNTPTSVTTVAPSSQWLAQQLRGRDIAFLGGSDSTLLAELRSQAQVVSCTGFDQLDADTDGTTAENVVVDVGSAGHDALLAATSRARDVLAAGGMLVVHLAGDAFRRESLQPSDVTAMLEPYFPHLSLDVLGDAVQVFASTSPERVPAQSRQALIEQLERRAATAPEPQPNGAVTDWCTLAVRDLQRDMQLLKARLADDAGRDPSALRNAGGTLPASQHAGGELPDATAEEVTALNNKITWLRKKITSLEADVTRRKRREKIYEAVAAAADDKARLGKLERKSLAQHGRKLMGYPPLNQAAVKKAIERQLVLGGTDAAHRWIASAHASNRASEPVLWRTAFDTMAAWHPRAARDYARRAVDANPYDESLRDRVQAMRDELAGVESGAAQADTRPPLRANRPVVAAILDEFSAGCLVPEWDLIPVSRQNWERELRARRPVMLFAESAWRGNSGEWSYAMTKPDGDRGSQLADLVEWCKAQGIPTVFWNKEDPANFNVFLRTARLFDHVFTTDADCIPRYVEALGHDQVHALPFAAQPWLHNPMGAPDRRLPKACFAGSYRGDKYPHRAEELKTLVEPLLAAGAVDIYDRFFGTADEARYGFPPPYRAAVIGSLPYEELVAKYREYALFLNVNSVQDSPTMFSRRVFEIMACRTPVVSTWQRGIEDMLDGTCLLTRSASETSEAVNKLLHNESHWAAIAQAGYRKVMSEHTYESRTDAVMTQVGVPFSARPARKVTVICVSRRPQNFDLVMENYTRQIYRDKELVYVFHGDEADVPEGARSAAENGMLRLLVGAPTLSLGECLNLGRDASDSDLWTKLDDDDHYGAHYLADAVFPFDYTAAGLVGKRSYFCFFEELDQMAIRFAGNEFRYTNLVHGGTLMADRERTAMIPFEVAKQGTDTLFVRACVDAGVPVFSADRFNFVHMRYRSPEHHTWQITEQAMMQNCQAVTSGFDHSRVDV